GRHGALVPRSPARRDPAASRARRPPPTLARDASAPRAPARRPADARRERLARAVLHAGRRRPGALLPGGARRDRAPRRARVGAASRAPLPRSRRRLEPRRRGRGSRGPRREDRASRRRVARSERRGGADGGGRRALGRPRARERRARPGGAPTVRYADVEQHLAARRVAVPTLADVRETVLAIRRSKSMVLDPCDPNRRSCGSFFTNPIVSAADCARVEALARDPAMPR